MTEVYYRFENRRQSHGYTDVCGEYVFTGSSTYLVLETYEVISLTPKGAWIADGMGGKRFVCNQWNKRFALPTIEEALHSFKKRKERQASIHEAHAREAREAIALADLKKYQSPDFPFRMIQL